MAPDVAGAEGFVVVGRADGRWVVGVGLGEGDGEGDAEVGNRVGVG
jgi:hypothetical protein